jgi:hypothetical protein
MSRYRRNAWSTGYNSNQPTKVSIYWSQKASAYSIKFMDTHHWDEMQIFIQYLKNIPYGERDYDPDNKTWFLIEKHLGGFKQMLEMIPQHFTVDFQEKPTQAFQGSFVPIDIYLDKFKTLTDIDARTTEYTVAKKAYRRVCMANHPDLHRGDIDSRTGEVIDYGKIMSSINECWTSIEKEFYKMKKEPEYA